MNSGFLCIGQIKYLQFMNRVIIIVTTILKHLPNIVY